MKLQGFAKLLCLWLALAGYVGQSFALGSTHEHSSIAHDFHSQARPPSQAGQHSHQAHSAEHQGHASHHHQPSASASAIDHSAYMPSGTAAEQSANCCETDCQCEFGHCASPALSNATLHWLEAPAQGVTSHPSSPRLHNSINPYRPPILV